ncbi:MAG: type I restriction-modification system subunit M N-terminal domain-containing protein [Desulfobacterales bacterium]|nr:type I restriction-modification system subunit M N-terminal domain-containing protein [Desulfobacterales bacterium]
MSPPNFSSHAAFIWSVADRLRGDYKQSDYGKVILPLTVLRRLDCVLAATKPAVLAEFESKRALGAAIGPFRRASPSTTPPPWTSPCSRVAPSRSSPACWQRELERQRMAVSGCG